MKKRVHERLRTYLKLSSELSLINDADIATLLSKNQTRNGWGSNHQFKIAGTQIFAKKIPLTSLERENCFDTKNLYRLPQYYNYGVGSAGFGAFRELLTHIKTTNWVLGGEHSRFPLMYHYRILPRIEKPISIDRTKHRLYLKKWNNNSAIDYYIRERTKSPYEIVLFLEHFPQMLASQLCSESGRVQSISDEMCETLSFLKSKGVLHFDAHLHNILLDGKSPILTDFGLALDKQFNLSKSEQRFFQNHSHYDFGEFISCLGMQLDLEYRKFAPSKKGAVSKLIGVSEDVEWLELQEAFLSNLDLLKQKKIFSVQAPYFRYLEKHRDTILLSNEFFYKLGRNPKKNTKFDNSKLKRALGKAL